MRAAGLSIWLVLVGIGAFGRIPALRAQGLSVGGKLYGPPNAVGQILGSSSPDIAALSGGFSTNQVIRGKPFSAAEERRTLQILRDGTRIDNGERNRLFRDGQGRTRMEGMNGTITIFDPVAGFQAELDPSSKIARRQAPGAQPVPVIDNLKLPNSKTAKPATQETSVTLKPQLVNGVLTQGIRTTMTIPKGQIGNDRDIKVVTERWVSDDLQMLIKSTNNDPRYGETTYQLTNIIQREPDPLLFQIPSDYTVIPEGGRGGRSPAPGGRIGPPGGRSPIPGGRSGPGGRSPEPPGTN